MTNRQKIKLTLTKALTWYIATLMTLSAFLVGYEYKTDDTTWLEIETIEPLKSVYGQSEIPLFYIVAPVHREVDELNWQHSIRCRDLGTRDMYTARSWYTGGVDAFKPENIDSEFAFLPDNKLKPLPDQPSECFIRARLAIKTPFSNQSKAVVAESVTFIVR